LFFQVTASTLTLSWPGDHIGWRLQVKSNAAKAKQFFPAKMALPT
jgi:hypothetical protein